MRRCWLMRREDVVDRWVWLYKRRSNGLGGKHGPRVLYQNLNLNLNMDGEDGYRKGLPILCLRYGTGSVIVIMDFPL